MSLYRIGRCYHANIYSFSNIQNYIIHTHSYLTHLISKCYPQTTLLVSTRDFIVTIRMTNIHSWINIINSVTGWLHTLILWWTTNVDWLLTKPWRAINLFYSFFIIHSLPIYEYYSWWVYSIQLYTEVKRNSNITKMAVYKSAAEQHERLDCSCNAKGTDTC